MTDNLLTRDEAIQAMARGEKCETYSDERGGWAPMLWRDLDRDIGQFRRPPEPRREVREWADVHGISWGNRGQSLCFGDPIHVREVLPDEVTLRRMTEDEALEEFQKWRIATKARYADMACYLAPLRALGLIVEEQPW